MTPTPHSTSESRTKGLARRLAHQSLAKPARDLQACEGLDLGFQNAGPGTAEAALALRLEGGASAVRAAVAAGDLVNVMTLR